MPFGQGPDLKALRGDEALTDGITSRKSRRVYLAQNDRAAALCLLGVLYGTLGTIPGHW